MSEAEDEVLRLLREGELELLGLLPRSSNYTFLARVDGVGLVQEHNDVRHPHLARQQDVFTRLRHRAIGGRYHQNRRHPSAPHP